MRALPIVLMCIVIMPCSVCAKDWKVVITQLEREPLNATNKKLLAIAYNNRAIELQQDSAWTEAEALMKKAILFDSRSGFEDNLAMIHLNHAIELYRERASQARTGAKHEEAKRYAQRALSYNKELTKAHLLIGDIEYENQRLSAARKAWESAKRINPNAAGVDQRLQSLRRESSVEKKFTKTGNAYFDIRYQADMDATTTKALRLAADTARQVVGKDFGYRPRHKLVILVYPRKSFAALKLGPHWASGSYDGKIRLPLDRGATESALTSAAATLFHEITHATVHDLSHDHCPTWLNEGLAEIQEAKLVPGSSFLLRDAAERDMLIPVKSLDLAFRASDPAVISLAYQQAHSLAQFLTQHTGYRRVRRLLERLGEEIPFELALRETCNLTGVGLEAKWKSWLASNPER